MNRSLAIVIAAPLLACATSSGGGGSAGKKYPPGVEVRASCWTAPPASGFAETEQQLLTWLEGAGTQPGYPLEMQGGEACDRPMLGPVDWASQHIAFVPGAKGGTVVKMRIRGSTLVVFREVQRQCGGAEMPMFHPGTSVVVVPASVESVEYQTHSERCDWEKKGLPPPP